MRKGDSPYLGVARLRLEEPEVSVGVDGHPVGRVQVRIELELIAGQPDGWPGNPDVTVRIRRGCSERLFLPLRWGRQEVSEAMEALVAELTAT